jgi:hypothetical protein
MYLSCEVKCILQKKNTTNFHFSYFTSRAMYFLVQAPFCPSLDMYFRALTFDNSKPGLNAAMLRRTREEKVDSCMMKWNARRRPGATVARPA